MIAANQRIAGSLAFIDEMLTEFKSPAVLWSSGKDSMVLLHLVRRVRKDLPVVFFREPFQPRRYAFANDIIEDWELNVHEWPPIATAVAFKNDTTSLVHRFQVAPDRVDPEPDDDCQADANQAPGQQADPQIERQAALVLGIALRRYRADDQDLRRLLQAVVEDRKSVV